MRGRQEHCVSELRVSLDNLLHFFQLSRKLTSPQSHLAQRYMKNSKAQETAEQEQLQFLAVAKKTSLREAMDAGVDPKDLEDSPALAASSSGAGGSGRRAG